MILLTKKAKWNNRVMTGPGGEAGAFQRGLDWVETSLRHHRHAGACSC